MPQFEDKKFKLKEVEGIFQEHKVNSPARITQSCDPNALAMIAPTPTSQNRLIGPLASPSFSGCKLCFPA